MTNGIMVLSVKGTNEWGSSGSNGDDVVFKTNEQSLKGKIELDELSTLDINLINDTDYEGMINTENSAKEVKLTLDSSSIFKLTGDTYVTSLDDENSTYDNIDLNRYHLYVNGESLIK